MKHLLVAALLLADSPGRLEGKQHMETPEPKGALAVKDVSASTTLPDWKGYTFTPKNLIDGSTETSWQPKTNKKTGGVGEWVQLQLERECTVERLEIANGLQMYDKLGNLFYENSRVAEARLVFSDGSEQLIALEANDFRFVTFTLAKVKTSSVKLEVQKVHKGTKWNDLAISELALYGACP